MSSQKDLEQLLADNSGVDAGVVREAERQLKALEEQGMPSGSTYNVDPALGSRAPLRQQRLSAQVQVPEPPAEQR